MRRAGRFFIYVLLGSFLLIAGGLVALKFVPQESEPVITSNLVGNQLQAAQELTTTKYMYTNAGDFENQNDFYGWKVPFTRKRFIVSYEGVIHVGVDLEEVGVSVNEQTITVTMPDAKILSHDLDVDSLKVYDESSSIFNPIRVEDYQAFTAEQEKLVESQAIERGLLDEANQQAQEAVKAVLEMNPDIAAQYTIEFN